DYYEAKIHMWSVALYQALEEETGQSTGWHTTGALRLGSTPDRMDELKYNAVKDRCLGLEVEVIGPQEIKRLHPLVNTDGLLGALWHPDDGDVDPNGITQAMAIGARKYGAEIYRHTLVGGIHQAKSGEWLVQTDKGEITCEHVVNAGGLWAPEVGRMVGLDLPSIACEHHHILFEAIPEAAERQQAGRHFPLVRDPDRSIYFRQEMDSFILGMYESEGVVWRPEGVPWDYASAELPIDLDRITPYLQAGIDRFPIMETAGLKRIVCGPITYTPNGDPLVGPAFPLRNFWLCCGYSFGITQAGGIGRYLAEWMMEGQPSIDPWPTDSRRYGSYANKSYNLQKIADTYPRLYGVPFPHQFRDAARPVKTSPIYERQKAAGAVFGDAFGWERAQWFSDKAGDRDVDSWRRSNWHEPVGQECKAVMNGAGLLDLTGFSKFLITGPGACAFLERLSCNKVPAKTGRMAIFPALTEQGTFLSDMTCTKLDEVAYLIVSAAVAKRHDHHHLLLNLPPDGSVALEDVTTKMGCLVIAGPASRQLLQKLTETDMSNEAFPFATSQNILIDKVPVQANRLNFVGELGWELFHPIEQQLALYDKLKEAGSKFGLSDFGIRAMDSMRLEKGYCTWKGELNIHHTPWEAGLDWQVRLDKDFIGKEALIRQKEEGLPAKLALMRVEAADADAYGYNGIYKDGEYVGMTSSGGYGHRVGASLALGYIKPELAERGTELEVEILNERFKACVVQRPYYDPKNERLKAYRLFQKCPLVSGGALGCASGRASRSRGSGCHPGSCTRRGPEAE
ncbi:MAG: FAD-dependent oxidoreductase, partial [Deltaproteobacteria bacterium]|nr:FAD-dependent oxidoreductase [Deltaproteobacteria bacterium]